MRISLRELVGGFSAAAGVGLMLAAVPAAPPAAAPPKATPPNAAPPKPRAVVSVKAEPPLILRVYEVADLVSRPWPAIALQEDEGAPRPLTRKRYEERRLDYSPLPDRPPIPSEELGVLVRRTVTPESWATEFRPELDSVSLLFQGTQLLIAHNEAGHRQIAALLAELRAQRRTITVSGHWLSAEPTTLNRFTRLLPGGAVAVDLAGLSREPNVRVLASGRATGQVGQRITLADGRARTWLHRAVSDYTSTAVGLDPRVDPVCDGGHVELLATPSPDGRAAVVELTASWSRWEKLVPARPSGRVFRRDVLAEGAVLDRVELPMIQLRTVLTLPMGRAILVGGQTGVATAPPLPPMAIWLVLEVAPDIVGPRP